MALTISTWNVNSIRARLERLTEYLTTRRPDVVCLQELKCVDDEVPRAELEALGYQVETHGQKTYNGVALLSRHPITEVARGLDDGVEDPHYRLIAGTVKGIRVLSLYAPNGQEVDSPAYQYKLAWYERLARYVKEREGKTEKLLLCGDFNIAPTAEDVYDPAAFEGQTLFTTAEKERLSALVGDRLHDCFRKHHKEPGRYSWWDYRMLGFPKNRGLRIDHLFASAALVATCTGSDIDREMRKGKTPSDHAPVWATFDV